MTSIVTPKVMDNLRPHLPPESVYRLAADSVPVDGGRIAVRCIQPAPVDDEARISPLGVAPWRKIFSVELRLSIVNVDYSTGTSIFNWTERMVRRYKMELRYTTNLNIDKKAANNAPTKLSASVSCGFLIGRASAVGTWPPQSSIARETTHFSTAADPLVTFCKVHLSFIPRPTSLNFFFECLQAHPILKYPRHFYRTKNYLPRISKSGLDQHRDEALLHARLLRECGVLTNFNVCVGFLSTAAGFGPGFLRRSSLDILASRMGSTSTSGS
ncbi:hypothetical protein B0H14DRAFT_2561111 [Mycena olivaceomarginata]|nr:hypothetical protein B0H14DRAFT_2561111 [Mycena olivaceomarginata]